MLRRLATLWLADLTVAEIVYVLQGPYARPRNEIARLVEATLSLGSVVVDNEAHLGALRTAEDGLT